MLAAFMPGPMELLIVSAVVIVIVVVLVVVLLDGKKPSGRNNPNLMPCPDCGQSVSLRATTCPHCGAPLETSDEQ